MEMDPYKILGLPNGSSELEVKKTYKKLAMLYHPDKGGDEEKFKEISQAYSHIIKGENPFEIPEFSGIFKMFGFSHTPRGPDIRTTIEITLEELEQGGDFEVFYIRRIPTGEVSNQVTETPFGIINIATPIEINKKYTTKINLPKCHDYRKTITYFGLALGENIPASNLIVSVILKKHEIFQHIPGTKDLKIVINIDLKESLLGFKRTIQKLNKEMLELDCSTIVNPYDNKRVRGIGLNGEGDMIISFRIKFPILLDSETRNIIKELHFD